jgi:hypothetical protein
MGWFHKLFCNERREATTHNDDDLGHTAPRWAGVLNEKLNRLMAGQNTIYQQIARNERADLERDIEIMATQEQVLEKVRQAKTVSESTNIAVKEALRLLREGQSDPAKNDEAIALLEATIADDGAVLTENTPEA